MENGKHKTNSLNSFNSWSKKQSLLPSLQGGAGGRLSPNQARSATNQASLRAANQVRSAANPQKRCSKCSKCFKCFRCFISLLDQKIARFWSKSEQNRCFKCFSCSKCSASTRSPNQARSATNQACLRAANQVRSAANPQKKVFQVFKFKIRITLLIFLKCCGAVITFPTAMLAKIFRMRA